MKEGKTFHVSGAKFTFGPMIGGGLEGSVYEIVEKPDFVVKIIKSDHLSALGINRLRKHLSWLKDEVAKNELVKNRFTFPKAILDDYLGYVMLKVKDHVKLSDFLKHPKTERDFKDWYLTEFSLKKRMDIIINLFNSLQSIHIAGLVFSDLSPNNILIHKTHNKVVFIDTDNIRRMSDFHINVMGTPGYVAPEVYFRLDSDISIFMMDNGIAPDTMPNTNILTDDSDIFSAAIIAFELLTLQHPFIGDLIELGTPEEEERALKCMTEYICAPDTNNVSTINPLVDEFIRLKTVTKEIKLLFEKTFVSGKLNPKLRPTASEFADVFLEASDKLVKCKHCNYFNLYEKDNAINCSNCGKPVDKEVILSIFDSIKSNSLGELLSRLFEEEAQQINEKARFLYHSEIVLQRGTNKNIYLHHLGKETSRDKLYATIKISESNPDYAIFEIADTTLLNGIVVNMSDYKIAYEMNEVKKRYQINFREQFILFDAINSNGISIKTFGRFGIKH
jgi:eukaryotic-like serine/threonine-protein kinase